MQAARASGMSDVSFLGEEAPNFRVVGQFASLAQMHAFAATVGIALTEKAQGPLPGLSF